MKEGVNNWAVHTLLSTPFFKFKYRDSENHPILYAAFLPRFE